MGPSNGKVRASHGEARPTAAVTRPTAAVTRPTAAVSVNLAGRDLSKLPDWQRQILEKKYRVRYCLLSILGEDVSFVK